MPGSSPMTTFSASTTRDVFTFDQGLNWHSVLFFILEPRVLMETHSSFKAEPCCSAGCVLLSYPLSLFTLTLIEGYLFPLIPWDEDIDVQRGHMTSSKATFWLGSEPKATAHSTLYYTSNWCSLSNEIQSCIGRGHGEPSLTSVLHAFLT